MLMVIFGAGASYDSYASRRPQNYPPSALPDRLPLADHLFDDRAAFNAVMDRFPKCGAIIPTLRDRQGQETVEQVLQRYEAESQSYAIGKQQLASVLYYLQVMIWECEDRWRSVHLGKTNHLTLLNKIERWRSVRNEAVCLATFNYDTLLERALSALFDWKFAELSDYDRHQEYKLFKLHGSVNWAHPVEIALSNSHLMSPEGIAKSLIDRADRLSIVSQSFEVIEGCPASKTQHGMLLFPALAIPVESKDQFECPAQHLAGLEKCIPQVDKILVIGWQAREQHFLRMLRERLKPDVSVLIICANQLEAQDTAAQLSHANIKAHVVCYAKYGFSDFALDNNLDSFLATTVSRTLSRN